MGCARTDRLAKSWAGRDNRAGGESGRTAAGTAGQDPAPKGPGPRTRDGKPGASRRVPGSRPAAPPTSDRDPSCGPLLTDHFVGPHRAHRPANQRGDQQGARAPAHDPRSYSHRRPPGGCRSLRQRPHEWLDSSPEFHRLPEATHLWDIGRTESPATPDSRGALRSRRQQRPGGAASQPEPGARSPNRRSAALSALRSGRPGPGARSGCQPHPQAHHRDAPSPGSACCCRRTSAGRCWSPAGSGRTTG